MARWLKQSTSVDVPIGPFLDATDGVTAETALTITQPDIRLKKNGGAWAQKNAAQTLSHEENGNYEATLDATDTNTLGLLRLHVAESGALPVWEDFVVVPANVWDSLFGADALQVHAVEISNDLITAAAIADNAIDAGALAADCITAAKIATGAIDADAIADNAIDAGAIASGAITAAKFAAGAIDAAAISADAITDAKVASDVTIASVTGAVGSVMAGVTVTTNNDKTGYALSAAGVDAIYDEAASGHTTAGTFGDKLRVHQAAVLKALVTSGSTTTAVVLNATTGIEGGVPSATNDFYNGRVIIFITGALAGQATDITDYVGATQTLTVTALTGAPASGDTAVIV